MPNSRAKTLAPSDTSTGNAANAPDADLLGKQLWSGRRSQWQFADGEMVKIRNSAEAPEDLPVHAADLQVGFWAFLQQIRNKHLSQALSNAVSRLDVADIDRELARYAQPEGLSILARAGLRGETFFPVP